MRLKTETFVGIFMLAAVAVFLYMSFKIGVWRFDTMRYTPYTVYFHDVSGLNPKADVEIAGVKVGWVEAVSLINNGQQVRADIMLSKNYTLHANAHGLIRQDGLLGTRFLEIVPGDTHLPAIKPGGVLMKPSHDPVAVDGLLHQFKDIAVNIQKLSETLVNVLSGEEGSKRLESTVRNLAETAERLASFAEQCNKVVMNNQDRLESTLQDIQRFSHELRTQFPQLSNKIGDAAVAVNKDFDRMADSFDAAARPIARVAQNFADGKGVLGSLLSDEEMARDVRQAVQGVKKYVSQIDKIGIVFDSYFESMHGKGGDFNFQDAKGYFNARIHPQLDYFYLLGLAASYSGRVVRSDTYRRWYNGEDEIIPTQLTLDPRDQLKYAQRKSSTKRVFDESTVNVQFGKIYGPLALRAGLFESTFGAAVDYELPLDSDRWRWITSLEAYDFKGRNRLEDDRPHLKWLNKVFCTDTIYFVFGADDFISKANKNAFFGAGLRFADDDVKYLMSRVSLG